MTTLAAVPTHHPAPERLMEYAAGAASAERALVLVTHIGACQACAAQARAGEEIAADLLERLPAAPLRPDALAHALARIERPDPRATRSGAKGLAPRAPEDWIAVPRVVAEAAHRRRRWAAPGIWVAPVAGGRRGPRGYLLRVAAGMSMPRHTHRGAEMVCILKGAFLDRGETFAPGDLCETDESVVHKPAAHAVGECVCLVAVENSLVTLDWLGKLFQPLVRI